MTRMLLIALLAFASACAMRAPETAGGTQPAVYVIRHLEKGTGEDPPLTTEGRANAAKLADLLAEKRIAAIFATETRRAMETAAPLAQRLRLKVTPYDPRDPKGLVAAVRHARAPVLVVGHSNTVPEIVELLGASRPGAIDESDYGTLFIVGPGATATTAKLR